MLGSLPAVIAQDASEMLATLDDPSLAADFLPGFDEVVSQPLMIARLEKMANVCMDGSAQALFSDDV